MVVMFTTYLLRNSLMMVKWFQQRIVYGNIFVNHIVMFKI